MPFVNGGGYVAPGGDEFDFVSGHGNTEVPLDDMMKFVSEQIYTVRHYAQQHRGEAPGTRIGFSWQPGNRFNASPDEFEANAEALPPIWQRRSAGPTGPATRSRARVSPPARSSTGAPSSAPGRSSSRPGATSARGTSALSEAQEVVGGAGDLRLAAEPCNAGARGRRRPSPAPRRAAPRRGGRGRCGPAARARPCRRRSARPAAVSARSAALASALGRR